MKISIVIPFYNASAFMSDTLSSIIAQTFPDFELICVDDCSTDDTCTILKRYAAQDSRIRIVRTMKNSGSARKPLDLGISVSQGDFLCLVGHDDKLAPDYIELLADRQKATSVDIVFGKMIFFDKDRTLFSIPREDFDLSQILTGREAVMLTIGSWQIGANGALIKRELLISQRKNSKIDPCLMNADEYDTRDLLVGAKYVAFTNAGYFYRQHQASVTKQFSRQFECLETDRCLKDLFSDKFGIDSPEYRKMLNEFIASIIRYSKSYKTDNNRFAEENEKLKASAIIRRNFKSLKWSEIMRSDLKFRRKIRFFLPYQLFLKFS